MGDRWYEQILPEVFRSILHKKNSITTLINEILVVEWDCRPLAIKKISKFTIIP